MKSQIKNSHTQQRPNSPLASRMRPRSLDEFIGQSQILGPGRLLRRAIQADQLSSILLYGPPGTGKTTLAQIIANTTHSHFIAINAVLAGIKEIREALDVANLQLKNNSQKTILFVDEVHRFNKTQQDALLPHVENGTLILIGATTENPYFEVNKALVSRSRIFQMKALEEDDIATILNTAIGDRERGYGKLKIDIDAAAFSHLIRCASGDARNALNALELAVETTGLNSEGSVIIDLPTAEESIQKRAVLYDKDGDSHYDTISAFIKSVRGSDPDASLYWMAKMLYAGEQPRFIFRRMLILASEDVGLADPQALGIVTAASQAFEYVGLPEGHYHLTQACLYLAMAPKSNSAKGFFEALKMVGAVSQDEVPHPLQDKSRDGKDLGHGHHYKYPHDYANHWVAQQYLPQKLTGVEFYQPSTSGYEAGLKLQLQAQRLSQRNRGEWDDDSKPVLLEEILRFVPIQRESLVLDLTCGKGELLNELCKIATVGGVWERCQDTRSQELLSAQYHKMKVVDTPVFFISDLNFLSQALGHFPQPPKFDFVLGINIRSKIENLEAWLLSIIPFTTPETTLLFVDQNVTRGQTFLDLLPLDKVNPLLWEKVNSLEHEWRKALHTVAWQQPIESHLGWSFSAADKDFVVQKKFTVSQIKDWFSPQIKDRHQSFLSKLSQELTEDEKHSLEQILNQVFALPKNDWKQSYDFLVVKRSNFELR